MAGTATKGPKRQGTLNGAFKDQLAYPIDYVADAADGSFPAVVITNITGRLAGVRLIFGTPIPNNIDIQVADRDGVDLLGGNGAGFTATGKVTLSPPEQFDEQLTIVLSGNTANSAQVKVVINVF